MKSQNFLQLRNVNLKHSFSQRGEPQHILDFYRSCFYTKS